MQIVFTSIKQGTFAAAGADVTVILTYELLGPGADFVECYATNAAGQGLGVLEDQFDVSLTEFNYSQNITLKAGSYYTVGLCPRTGPKDSPDQEIDGEYWESYCVFATLVTQSQPPPPPPPPPSPSQTYDPGPPVMAQAVPFRRLLLTWDHTWYALSIMRLSLGNALAEDWVPNPTPGHGHLIDTGPFIFNSTYRYWAFFYRNPTDYRSTSNDVVFPTWFGLKAFLPPNFDPSQGIKRLLPNDHPYVSVRKIMSGYV
jgi:hypothetical protein